MTEARKRADRRPRRAAPVALAVLLATIPGGAAADRTGGEGFSVPRTPRVIEGSPSGGFAYRILIHPDVSAAAPARLVVWLHPTGGAHDDRTEAMAPIFTSRGFALLIPAHADRSGWSGADAATLLSVTVPDAGRREGIDASRPILFGSSGGGQLAMTLWHARPGVWGGIIVNAAYPLDVVNGRTVAMELPAGPASMLPPIFALVGAEDPVAESWRKVEEAWTKAGLPLTVRYVPGRGHEWLFGDEERARLGDWLDARRPQPAVAPPQDDPAPAVQP